MPCFINAAVVSLAHINACASQITYLFYPLLYTCRAVRTGDRQIWSLDARINKTLNIAQFSRILPVETLAFNSSSLTSRCASVRFDEG